MLGITGVLMTGCSQTATKTVETAAEVSTETLDMSLESTLEDVTEESDEGIIREEYAREFTQEDADEFIAAYENAVVAHVEYCRPDDYEMLYYDLTDEDLNAVKELLATSTVDTTVSSGDADFTTTLHMFDDVGNYVYVIALNEDDETMFIEPGQFHCDGLTDLLVSFRDKAEINDNYYND
jgi:hypothetical protein